MAFNDVVKDQMLDIDADYFRKVYATIILYRTIDKLCRKQKLAYKSNVVSYTLSYISLITNKSLDLQEIFERQDVGDELKDVINNLLPRIYALVTDPPAKCPEVRMWARKEELWNRIKKMGFTFTISKMCQPTDFFPENKPKVFINNDDNFYNESLWNRLRQWNDKAKLLNSSQTKMVKGVIARISASLPFTKKQIAYAKDIFMAAVKGGFEFDK